jgi:hypothetical protein
VWISEDATKITGKIEYNSKNNTVVGFEIPQENGLPKTNFFEATSAQNTRFFRNQKRADYAYGVMAQCPVDGCPSFCLNIFGTDNCFTHEDVLSRWNRIKMEATKNGIKILGFSSDGDTMLLKAMRISSKLFSTSTDHCQWPWFHLPFHSGDNCIQDTVHIGTKLKTRKNSKISIKIGKYVATSLHLQTLIQTVTKDQHLLTMGDIQSEDKMNFSAVEKITALSVSQLLNDHVEDSKGTVIYLKMLRSVLQAFLNKTLQPRRRVYLMWYSVFFLRIWRNWLKESHTFSVTKNFITLNAYLCIE